MNSHDTRLDRLERRRAQPRQSHTFVPLGIAHTDGQDAWLLAERHRLGLTDQDQMLAFMWMPGESA